MNEPKVDLSQLVPLITGLIILLGLTNYVFYFGYFGIDILHYIEFSEIFISFLESPLILFIGAIGGIFYSLLTYDRIYSKLGAGSIRIKEISDKLASNIGFWKKFLLMLEYQQQYFWLSLGTTVVYFIIGLFTGEDFPPEELVTMLKVLLSTVLITTFIKVITLTTLYKTSHIDFKNIVWFLFFSLIVTAMIAYKARLNAEYVKKQKGLYNASIVYTNDLRFYPTSLVYFIGKTNNYAFLYHEKDSVTEIIPMSDIKRITYDHKLSSK